MMRSAALFLLVMASGLSAATKPNIVFILADDLGYGDVGCYGQEKIRTPNIDRLATEGTRFTQAYAGSTVCAPSRCVLMTGLHTGHAKVRGNALVPLGPEDVCVAELLKNAGYTTGLFGKWGLGEPNSTGIPTRKGFDSFFGYLNQQHAHNYYPDYLWRNTDKVLYPKNVVTKGVADPAVDYSPDAILAETFGFLDAQGEKPFFLYFASTLPHANNEHGKDGMEIPNAAPYNDKPWPTAAKNHAAMITRLDTDVGKIMAKIKERGWDDNTIVIFSSDNGPHKEGGADPRFFESSGPLRGIKRSLTEGGIRVPTIVRAPGRVPAKRVSDVAWYFADFLPTACELAGVEAPKGLDGVSIVPQLKGDAPLADRYLYWEFHEGGFQQAVRWKQWKYLKSAKGTALYDVNADIGEAHDVKEEHPAIVQQIEAYLKTARTDSKEFPIRPKAKN